jgi:ribosome biogenesis GTPase
VDGQQQGTVRKVSREYAWVLLDAPSGGRCEVLAKPRGRLELAARRDERLAREAGVLESVTAQQLTVGDRVTLLPPPVADAGALWAITGVGERETWLIRKSLGRYRHRAQLVVANADQLAVVVAPNPVVRVGTVDRYFLAAMQGGVEPLLIVNKIDLDPELPGKPEILGYRGLGYRVLFTAAQRGAGLDELQPLLEGKLTVFCGHSGVGKSTLLSQLTGLDLKTAEVRARDSKGRQTTVTAEGFILESGGMVVDTPGVREFGLAHLTWLDVHEYFSDIAALTLKCGFADCTHGVEPGCAVRQAIAAGELAAGRLESYRKLRAEAAAGERDRRRGG